jgi:hypothetical protein
MPHKAIVFSNTDSDLKKLSKLIYFSASQNSNPTTIKLNIKNFEKCLGCAKTDCSSITDVSKSAHHK